MSAIAGGAEPDDEWAPHVESFVDGHYGTLRGRVRTHVVDEQLAAHLPAPPLRIVDIGGGAGEDAPVALGRRDPYRQLSRLFHLVGIRLPVARQG